MSLVYLDSSALVKLIVREPESAALAEFLRGHSERVASALSLTEVPRALGRAGFGAAERRRARAILTRVALVDVDRRTLAAAAALDPSTSELRELRGQVLKSNIGPWQPFSARDKTGTGMCEFKT